MSFPIQPKQRKKGQVSGTDAAGLLPSPPVPEDPKDSGPGERGPRRHPLVGCRRSRREKATRAPSRRPRSSASRPPRGTHPKRLRLLPPARWRRIEKRGQRQRAEKPPYLSGPPPEEGRESASEFRVQIVTSQDLPCASRERKFRKKGEGLVWEQPCCTASDDCPTATDELKVFQRKKEMANHSSILAKKTPWTVWHLILTTTLRV
ncbi:uncharacterized protein LOC110218620 [Phascolarctos cinereus]